MRLKWGQTEYKGTLVSVDSYMNIQLSKTEEFIDGKCTGSLGEVLIRCATYNTLLMFYVLGCYFLGVLVLVADSWWFLTGAITFSG